MPPDLQSVSASPVEPSTDRLDSWKEIAAYLGRSVKTVHRWEDSEGLPVHRLQHEKRGSVFAYKSELDAWRERRKVADPLPMAEAVQPPPARRLPFRWILGGLAILALLTASAVGMWSAKHNAAGAARIRSIAVLPLKNLSGDPAQEYFSDGVTASLISNLAQIHGIRVISFTSVMRYKGSTQPLSEIARALDVDGLIEGAVQRVDGRVRIGAQLIEAANDTHLWAREYDRDISDVLKIEAEVTRSITDEIRVQLTPQEAARVNKRTVSTAAQDEYLLGHDHIWKMTETDQLEAMRHFQQAVRLQPDFAEAFAQISSVWAQRALFTGGVPFHQAERPAMEAISKALELDPDLDIAHVTYADLLLHYRHDWDGAEREYERALELNPNSLDAHNDHACLLAAVGRFPEAFAELDRAASLDPLNPFVQQMYGTILNLGRRYDEAAKHFRRALELDPQNSQAHMGLIRTAELTGNYANALSTLEERVRSAGGDINQSVPAGILYAEMGRRDDALRVVSNVPKSGANPSGLARLYFALGDMDRGFEWLAKYFDTGSPIFVSVDPAWDTARRDPRFIALVQRLGLPNTTKTKRKPLERMTQHMPHRQ